MVLLLLPCLGFLNVFCAGSLRMYTVLSCYEVSQCYVVSCIYLVGSSALFVFCIAFDGFLYYASIALHGKYSARLELDFLCHRHTPHSSCRSGCAHRDISKCPMIGQKQIFALPGGVSVYLILKVLVIILLKGFCKFQLYSCNVPAHPNFFFHSS